MLSNSRPKTITVIIAMLLVLAVVSAVSTLTSRIGFGAAGGPNGAGGNPPAGGNFQGNANGAPGGAGQQGNSGNSQNRRAAGGFNMFSIARTLGLNGQVMVYINLIIPVIGIALLLFSAYGVWKFKSWGLNLATLLAVVFLIGALPGLFSTGGRNINWLRIGLDVVSLAATLPILGLSFLPSVRDFFPKPASKPKTRTVA